MTGVRIYNKHGAKLIDDNEFCVGLSQVLSATTSNQRQTQRFGTQDLGISCYEGHFFIQNYNNPLIVVGLTDIANTVVVDRLEKIDGKIKVTFFSANPSITAKFYIFDTGDKIAKSNASYLKIYNKLGGVTFDSAMMHLNVLGTTNNNTPLQAGKSYGVLVRSKPNSREFGAMWVFLKGFFLERHYEVAWREQDTLKYGNALFLDGSNADGKRYINTHKYDAWREVVVSQALPPLLIDLTTIKSIYG